MDPLDRHLIRIGLMNMPKGCYHRRDDDPAAVYRDGSKVYDLVPKDKAAEGLAAVLVYCLNNRD